MLEQSKKVSNFVVELLNVGSKIVHKQGIATVFQLSDEAMALGNLDMVAMSAEWAGPVEPKVDEMVASVTAKLSLENKAVEAKVKAGVAVVGKAVVLLSKVSDLVQEAKAVLA